MANFGSFCALYSPFWYSLWKITFRVRDGISFSPQYWLICLTIWGLIQKFSYFWSFRMLLLLLRGPWWSHWCLMVFFRIFSIEGTLWGYVSKTRPKKLLKASDRYLQYCCPHSLDYPEYWSQRCSEKAS